MQITISGHHVGVTKGLEKTVRRKLTKHAKHYPELSAIHVVLTVERHTHIAELTTHYLGRDLAAKSENNDLYFSISDLANKLEALLYKRKNIVNNHANSKLSPDKYTEQTQDHAA